MWSVSAAVRASLSLSFLPRRLRVRTAWLCLAGSLAGPAWALPSYTEVRGDFRPSETWILSREGEPLQRLRTDSAARRGNWTPLADISPALRMALVLSEDQRFYAHSGVDWAAVTAAAWGNLWNSRTRGASTITMQLAGLLDEDWHQSGGGRSVTQKLGQAVAAQRLERSWRKDQILEAYLNLVPFRGEIVGIDALSRSLFGKAPHGLDLQEAAIAAALVRAPNASAQRVAQRACGVWRDMLQAQSSASRPRPKNSQNPSQDKGEQPAEAVRCDVLEWQVSQILQQRRWPASEGEAPHFARQWLQRVPDSRKEAAVRTSLRADVQRVALQSLRQHLLELSGRNVEDGAVVVLDNASGEVLAWVGSSGSLSQAQEVDGVLARRQPGSTLKPFLYAQAIAEKRLTAASLIEDSAAQIRTANGLYIPQNYDRSFKGWVSARTALGASLNVPAVRTLVMVTPDAFFEQLQALGLRLPESGGYYGYSLALGSSEVTLLDLTNAYRALANQGLYTPVAWGSAARPAALRAVEAGAAFVVGDMLADRNARAMTFGLDSVLATRFWTAVKTGTSKDMRDNWVVGWSSRYTVGVWVGNASGASMHSVSGASGAAPVWAEVMGHLHARQPSRPPQPPAGVAQQAVRYGADPVTGVPPESARQEWFLPGTAQAEFQMGGAGSQVAAGAGRILQPVDGSVLALDPDIPPSRQRVQLRARAGEARETAQWRWRVAGETVPANRRALGQGAQAQWFPWPGRHRIELVAADGRVLDSVQIEVRGAGVR
ncbi:penicillin-binding protein 1C [Comamonas terrigena]|uniref:penicillin-binding protein 1C n=1 Tax=Comamonas terrigena TaxID=32013 RepID=UPI003C7E64B8